MGERLSLRAYALHRECTLAAVQKAIESGRLKEPAFGRDDRGRLAWIDVELADRHWSENTDPAAAAKAGKTMVFPEEEGDATDDSVARADIEAVDNATARPGSADLVDQARQIAADMAAPAPPPPPSSSSADYQKARAQREHYSAAQARIDYQKNIGLLVSAAEVRESAFKRYRALRDKLLNIPDRVATILAAERDPVRVHAALTEELKRVLSDLSTDAVDEAAGGAAERVAA